MGLLSRLFKSVDPEVQRLGKKSDEDVLLIPGRSVYHLSHWCFGGNVNELLCLIFEKTEVALELLGDKSDELANAVEGHTFQFLRRLFFVIDVGNDGLHAGRKFTASVSPVEKVKVMALFREKSRDRHADRAGSADK